MTKINRNSNTRNSYVPFERESMSVRKSLTSFAGKSRKVLTIPLAGPTKKIQNELLKASNAIDALNSRLDNLVSKINNIAESVERGEQIPSEGFKLIEKEIVSYMNKFKTAQLNYAYIFQKNNKQLQKGLALSFHPNKAKRVKVLNKEGVRKEVDRIVTTRFNTIIESVKPAIQKIEKNEREFQRIRQGYYNL